MVLSTLFYGGHLMASNSLSAGDLMAFLVASQGVQRSLAQGSVLLGTVIRGMTAGTRIFEVMNGFKIFQICTKNHTNVCNTQLPYQHTHAHSI